MEATLRGSDGFHTDTRVRETRSEKGTSFDVLVDVTAVLCIF